MKFWTPERTDELVRRYDAGEKLDDIAKALGATLYRVCAKRVHLGLPPRYNYEEQLHAKPGHKWAGVRFEDASRQELRADIASRQLAYWSMPDEIRITLKRFIVPWSLP